MKKKTILLVSSAFYPDISPRSFRATELAKEFYRQGHEVTVITRFRNCDYSDFLSKFPINLKKWGKTSFPRVPYFRHFPFSFFSRGISRLLSVLFEYPDIEEMFLVKKMLKNESDYDLMISFAIPYPVHWGVARTRSAKNPIAKTWVADCGDPYMFARLDTFKKAFYFKYFEVEFCRKCNYISIPIEAMQIQFYPEFTLKIRVIPQGINLKEIQLYKGQIHNEKPVFVFAGTVIPGKRDLKLFLDFLSSLPTDFLFIIYTNQINLFASYKVSMGKKLEVKGYIDRLLLIYEMSKADFLVNVDTIYENHAHIEAVPSKLIDYAIANRPILNISSFDLDKEKVVEFLRKDYTRQRIVEKSNFEIGKVSKKFIELIQ